MDPNSAFEAARSWLETFWISHGPECIVAAAASLVVAALVVSLFRLNARLKKSETARLSETIKLSAKLGELEKKLDAAQLHRSMAERMLVKAAETPGAENRALAELRQELAVEAINRLEVMRLQRNESDLWTDLHPALDKLIVGLASTLARRMDELTGEAIDRELSDETLDRLHAVQQNRNAGIWTTLEPVLDAVIIKLAADLPESAAYALREKLEEELVEETHNRLIIAKAMRNRDDLWVKLAPVLDNLIVESASLVTPEELYSELKPLIVGWTTQLASSHSSILQGAISGRLLKLVDEVIAGSKDRIKETATKALNEALEQAINEQVSQACIASKKYVNALIMAAVPRMVNEAVQDSNSPLRKGIDASVAKERGWS